MPSSKLFLATILLVFVMLLYVYVGVPSHKTERFSVVEQEDIYKLFPQNKIIVSQGLGIPNIPIEPTLPDLTDVTAPSVDGTEGGPRSKFIFAYNQCKPECCSTSGGYSCNGGCPCLTKEQRKMTKNCSK